MKKLLILLFFPMSLLAQMKTTYGVYKNIPYVYYDGPGKTLVVIAQGVGEYASSFNASDLPNSKINAASTYASYASKGKVYPFDILVAQSYKAPGATGNPSQIYLMHGLSELIRSFNPAKVIGTGYSFGSQLMEGFYTNSQNGTKVTDYYGSTIFDGYVFMDGRMPGTPSWCANNKPVIMICATGGIYYNDMLNVQRKKKLYCPDQLQPAFYSITGGSHSTSWIHGYDEATVEGKATMEFIKSFEPKYIPIECPAKVDTVNLTVEFYNGADTLRYLIYKAP